MPVETDYQRGHREGHVDALLEEHTSRLNKINGSVERTAIALESMAGVFRSGTDKLASEITKLQEAARLEAERVKAAAEALAKDAAQRRTDLEATATDLAKKAADLAAAQARNGFRFTKYHGLAVLLLMLVAIAVTVYFAAPRP